MLAAGLAESDASWVLEMAPATSPSPRLATARCRVLVDACGIGWPFRAALDQWPLPDDSVPAILLRHLWQPGIGADPLAEAVRVLRPDGLLIGVSANPWHPHAWRELGAEAMHLPSWPHLQWLHARHHLRLCMNTVSQLKGLVPGLNPLLLVVARKRSRPARVTPLKYRRPQLAGGRVAVSQWCRAA